MSDLINRASVLDKGLAHFEISDNMNKSQFEHIVLSEEAQEPESTNIELLELVKLFPDLPVIAWVEYEVVGDDSCTRWAGKIGKNASVKEFIYLETYSGCFHAIYKDDVEELEVELADRGLSDEKIKEFIDGIAWNKAIFVDVDTPDHAFQVLELPCKE